MTNKKFFSLIHEGSVHAATGKKIIPGKEIASLKNAEEILTLVKEDAEKYRREVIAEVDILKDQAEKAGFEEGFKQWTERLAKLEEEIAKVRKDMEALVIPIALKAAKKIIGKEIEQSDQAINAIVAENIKAVSQHKRVTIYVNPKDLQAIESQRNNIKNSFENLEALSIRARNDVELGGCVIETELGIINAQLENRWRILEAAFSTMMKGSK